MILIIIFTLVVPYYQCMQINHHLNSFLDHAIIEIYYDNIYFIDQEICIDEKKIVEEIDQKVALLFDQYPTISNVENKYYFECNKMIFVITYSVFFNHFKIAKEVGYE